MLASSKHADAMPVDDAKRPELPKGWATVTVETFSNVVGGGTPSTHKDEYWDGQIPWITSADIHGIRDIRPRKKINDQAIRGSATNLLPSGSIIVVTRVGLGKVALVDESLCFSQDSQGLIFNTDELDGSYLTYYLSEAVKRFKYEGRGTTISGVTKRQLRELPVLLPPLPEQHRIVAEIEKQFTRLDSSVAALKRVQANLKRYRASVLKVACEGRLVSTEAELARAEGRDYEPADRHLERILAEHRARWEAQEKRRGKYKEPVAPDTSDLPELPEGWVWATVEQLLARSEYGTSVKCSYESEGLPVLRIPNIVAGDIDLTDIKYATRSLPIDAENALAKGDVLMCRTNGSVSLVGKTAVVNTELETHHGFASYLLRFRLIEAEVIPKWFHIYVTSQMGRAFIEQHAASSAGQNNISLSLIHTMPLPLPPLAEQRRIVAEVERRLSVIHQAEAAVEVNLTRAKRLRQSILKQAFSGKLVPQDPNDDPASVLLERIRAEREEAQAASKPKSRAKRRTARSSSEKQPALGIQEKTP